MLYVYTVDGTFKIEKENIGKKKKGNQSRNVFVAPLHRKTTAGAGQKRVRKYKEKRGASGLMANVTHISSDRLYFFLYLVHDLFANSFYHLARRFFFVFDLISSAINDGDEIRNRWSSQKTLGPASVVPLYLTQFLFVYAQEIRQSRERKTGQPKSIRASAN